MGRPTKKQFSKFKFRRLCRKCNEYFTAKKTHYRYCTNCRPRQTRLVE